MKSVQACTPMRHNICVSELMCIVVSVCMRVFVCTWLCAYWCVRVRVSARDHKKTYPSKKSHRCRGDERKKMDFFF